MLLLVNGHNPPSRCWHIAELDACELIIQPLGHRPDAAIPELMDLVMVGDAGDWCNHRRRAASAGFSEISEAGDGNLCFFCIQAEAVPGQGEQGTPSDARQN